MKRIKKIFILFIVFIVAFAIPSFERQSLRAATPMTRPDYLQIERVSGVELPKEHPMLIATNGVHAKLGFPVNTKYRNKISSPFGWRIHPISGDRRMHSGIDIAAPSGEAVLAARYGKVVFTGNKGGYGKTVILQHSNPSQQTLYAHLSSILVDQNQSVVRGEKIGLVGKTGNATGPHLHFELRISQGSTYAAINPGDNFGPDNTTIQDSQPTNDIAIDPVIYEIPDCETAVFGDCGMMEVEPIESSIPMCETAVFGDCL